MVQEMREALSEATTLLEEIAIRFQAGDPAEELTTRLGDLLATLGRVTLLPELNREFHVLAHGLEQAIATGQQWLDQASEQLATHQLRQRLQRAYGLPKASHGYTDGGFDSQCDGSPSPAGG